MPVVDGTWACPVLFSYQVFPRFDWSIRTDVSLLLQRTPKKWTSLRQHRKAAEESITEMESSPQTQRRTNWAVYQHFSTASDSPTPLLVIKILFPSGYCSFLFFFFLSYTRKRVHTYYYYCYHRIRIRCEQCSHAWRTRELEKKTYERSNLNFHEYGYIN